MSFVAQRRRKLGEGGSALLLKFMDLTQQTYNCIAEDWHRDHSTDDWWIAGTDYLVSLLSPGATVLDIGCGDGRKTNYLVKKGLKPTGLDFSEGLLKIAREENPGVEFLQMDLRELGNLSNQFDCLFAQASLLHIPKIEISGIINSLLKLLKSGGYFYVAVKGIKKDRPEEEIKIEDFFGCESKIFFSYFTLEEMRKYFEDAGLEIVWENVKKNGNCEWIQIIGRK